MKVLLVFLTKDYYICLFTSNLTHDMKRILTFLTVAFCATVIAISCGNDKKSAESGPVGTLFNMAEKAQALENSYREGKLDYAAFREQNEALEEEAKAFLEANKDYELTDADRDYLFEKAKAMAAAEGEKITPEEEKAAKEAMKSIKTLGDMLKMGMFD